MSVLASSRSRTFSRKSVASFLLGGLAAGTGVVAVALDYPILMAVILASSVLSIVLGVLAWKQVRRSPGRVRASPPVDWGIALSIIGVLFVLLLPAV
jgi:heme A synthase